MLVLIRTIRSRIIINKMEPIGKAGLLITRINRIAQRIFTYKLKKNNLKNMNPTQFNILFSLLEKDLIPIYELRNQLSLRKSTLTSVLDQLEELGKIKRIHSYEDRRNILIKLQNNNSGNLDGFKEIISQMNDIFYNGFSQSEAEAFEEKLSRILNNLIEYEKKIK